MFKTRKNLATLAVAAAVSGGAMMMAAPAHALNVSQNGLGEVLFYPYYTVKNGMDTVFTVVNTTNRTAVIKVRFREALNSREVRDFNVVLSPYDHWSAGITKDVAGNGAVVRTYDKTCTSPQLPVSSINAAAREIDFTDYLYTDASAARAPSSPGGRDGASTDKTRVQEGYFEIFLMGLSAASTAALDNSNAALATNKVEYYAKHVAGVPRDCSEVDKSFVDSATMASRYQYFTEPENVLKGHVTYFNPLNGQSFDAEPTAIESWRSGTHVVRLPGDDAPNLANGNDFVARGLKNGAAYAVTMLDSVDAASAVLSVTDVINEYVSGAGTATSWVVTFPTKHHYTDWPNGQGVTNGLTSYGQFAELFHKGWPTVTTNGAAGKSCDTIGFVNYDREEASKQGTKFSPVGSGSKICYEANVINFNGSALFGTGTNHFGVTTTDVGTAGWSNLTLTAARALTGTGGSFLGLPTIGFAATMRGTDSTVTNYGSSSAHAYQHGYTAP